MKPIDEFKTEIDAKKQHEVDSAMAKARAEVAKYQRRYEDLFADYELFREKSEWLSVLSEKQYEPAAIEAKSKTGTGEATACAIASDWHVYEVVKSERVSGLNTHNPDIAKINANNFFNGILAWTNIHRTSLKINELVLFMLGDFITNMLFEDQKTENAGLVQEETLFATSLIVGGLKFLIDNGGFKKIRMICCSGNHARPNKGKDVANSAVNTYEWLMYKYLSDFILPDEKILEWQIANGYHEWINIYGKWIRTHHGDWIKYQGGVGGLTIPMNKAIKAWNVGRKADFDIFGHWHQTMEPGLFYANGSSLGYAPFSVLCKGEYEPPQQGFIIMDSKRFITSIDRIFVR